MNELSVDGDVVAGDKGMMGVIGVVVVGVVMGMYVEVNGE